MNRRSVACARCRRRVLVPRWVWTLDLDQYQCAQCDGVSVRDLVRMAHTGEA